MKSLAEKAHDRSQRITLPDIHPGAYRIVNGVPVEDVDHRVLQEPPSVSGVRKAQKL